MSNIPFLEKRVSFWKQAAAPGSEKWNACNGRIDQTKNFSINPTMTNL